MDVIADSAVQLDSRVGARHGEVPITAVTSPRRRRRPLIALGALMVVMSALVAAWLVASASETRRVVVANGDLVPGRQIEEGDLLVVEVGSGLESSSISADQQDRILGRFVVGPIPSGTLLNESMLIDRESVVPRGRVVVGAVLAPGQLPVEMLAVGDQVELIDTGDGGQDGAATAIGIGEVFALSTTDGGYWVAIEVAKKNRLSVAGAAANDRLSLGMVG